MNEARRNEDLVKIGNMNRYVRRPALQRPIFYHIGAGCWALLQYTAQAYTTYGSSTDDAKVSSVAKACRLA